VGGEKVSPTRADRAGECSLQIANSSLSARLAAIAAQLTELNGKPQRLGSSALIADATSSFPVPDSPVSSPASC